MYYTHIAINIASSVRCFSRDCQQIAVYRTHASSRAIDAHVRTRVLEVVRSSRTGKRQPRVLSSRSRRSAFGRSRPETERRRQINGKKEFFGCSRRQVALSRADNSEDEIIKMGPRKTCQPWRADRSRKRASVRARSHARISRTKLFYEC